MVVKVVMAMLELEVVVMVLALTMDLVNLPRMEQVLVVVEAVDSRDGGVEQVVMELLLLLILTHKYPYILRM